MRKTSQIDQSGRIVIPAEMRASLGAAPGDRVVIEIDDETQSELRVFTAKQGLRRAQTHIEQYEKSSRGSPVDELIQDRRSAASC